MGFCGGFRYASLWHWLGVLLTIAVLEFDQNGQPQQFFHPAFCLDVRNFNFLGMIICMGLVSS
jgi:hypothetical protein